jgi:phosphate:Na+ symporter
MCFKGWINFELAAAMVLGGNIGTTITANLAALVANKPAKRSALIHLLFNFIGVVWAFPFLRVLLHSTEHILTYAGIPSPFEDVNSIPVAISILHSSFNILNTILLIGFAGQLEKLAILILPSPKQEKELFRLKYFGTGLLSTAELSILQARKEIALYGRRALKMFRTFRYQFSEINEEKSAYYFEKIQNYEEIMDRMEAEITGYLTRISEDELSRQGTERIRAMLRLVANIENTGDVCFSLAVLINMKKKEKIWFPQELRDNLNTLFDMLELAFNNMNINLEQDFRQVEHTKSVKLETDIKEYLGKLKQQYLDNLENQSYKHQAGVIYNEILARLGQLGEFIFHINDTMVLSHAPQKNLPPQ